MIESLGLISRKASDIPKNLATAVADRKKLLGRKPKLYESLDAAARYVRHNRTEWVGRPQVATHRLDYDNIVNATQNAIENARGTMSYETLGVVY